MKDFHLRFCLGAQGWPTRLFDLLADDYEDDPAPSVGGAYVLGASDHTMLTYPWGSSPIFYIGKSNDLNMRLRSHRNHILGAREDHDEVYWWPRYQYGAAFGADCAYYSRNGPQNVQNIEAELIKRFYDAFGSIPAANSHWPKKIKPKRD